MSTTLTTEDAYEVGVTADTTDAEIMEIAQDNLQRLADEGFYMTAEEVSRELIYLRDLMKNGEA